MAYDKKIVIGNLTVYNREGAIAVFKILCRMSARYRTTADTTLLDEARQDMITLGFTASECAKIELAA